jgi:hypothetical protein
MKKKLFFIKRGNKICWAAAILVGRSERGSKQNFILGLKKVGHGRNIFIKVRFIIISLK